MAKSASLVFLIGMFLPLLQARGGEGPELRLESAFHTMEIRGNLIQAKATFCELANDASAPPRLRAEALWHLAEAYHRQGGEGASITMLQHLGKTFSTTPPFTNAAATLAAEYAQERLEYQDVPDAADVVAAEDLARILRSALLLGDATEATAAANDLRAVLTSLNFELAITPTNETPSEAKDRISSGEIYQEYANHTDKILQELKTTPPKQLATPATLQILDELSEVDDSDPDDFRSALFTARNQLTDAMTTRDPEKVAAAVDNLYSLYAPMREGPPKLAWSIYVKGECAAAESIRQCSANNDFTGALRIRRQSVAVLHGSGVLGGGLILTDGHLVPEPLRFRLIGTLMFLENAVYAMTNDEEPRIVLRELRKTLEKLETLKADPSATVIISRIDGIIRKVNQATEQFEKGEIEAAIALLSDEIYGS